jgi:hypothetical protein
METATSDAVGKPSGPAAAVILAAGLAVFALGLLATLAEVIDGFGDWLIFSSRVGMLSGKTIIALCVYFLSWGGLTLAWRRSSPSLLKAAAATAILIALGLVGTFPLFFEMFGLEV